MLVKLQDDHPVNTLICMDFLSCKCYDFLFRSHTAAKLYASKLLQNTAHLVPYYSDRASASSTLHSTTIQSTVHNCRYTARRAQTSPGLRYRPIPEDSQYYDGNTKRYIEMLAMSLSDCMSDTRITCNEDVNDTSKITGDDPVLQKRRIGIV